MADKTTKIIEIEVEVEGVGKVTKQFEELADGTKKAVDSAEQLNAKFEDVYKGIEPLTTRMGEAEDRLYELSLAGDTTSKEYQELLKSVGNYRKVQIQTDLAVDQAATTMSEKLGGALTGAASAFSAVQGVMAITGSESEALEESLLKVQGAMAFQQGVDGVLKYAKSVGLASKVTAIWNAILNLNPLALIATTIIGIVTYLVTFTDALDVAIQLLKDLGDAIGITNFEENKLQEERNERSRQHMENMKAEQTLRDAEIAQLEALGKSTIKLRRQQLEADKASLEATAERLRLTNEGFQSVENYISGKEKEAELSATEIEVQAQIIALETQLIELDKEQEAVNKSNSEKAQARRDKKQKDLEEIARLEQEAIDRMVDEEIALQQTLDAIQRENEDRFRTEQENEILLVEEKYDALEASAFGNAEALEQIEIARLNELNDIKLKFADEEVAIETDKNKKIVEVEELTNKKKLELASASFTAIADLVGSFNTQNEKDAERQFKIQKAFNLAAAVTNTALAVTGALTAGGNPIKLATGAQFVEAGIAAAVGAANIVKIASSQFGQGDTGGGTQDISAPSVQAPQFNVVGDSGVNQLAQLQQQPTQAYVVSGEVTTAQALDRNRVQNATL